MRRVLAVVPLLAVAVALTPVESLGQQKKKDDKKKADDKQKPPARPQFATPAESLKVAKGFKVELLYSVPKDVQGSWVNLCVDPKGRLIASDQNGPLYRITVPPVGTTGEVKVEKIPAEIGEAQGLLWAFDALYVVTNSRKYPSGLYKVTDSNGDDQLDKVEQLRLFEGGGGEHGPHAVLPHPDGKRLTIVCGNQTKLVRYDTTRVPPVWGEDHLLPRMPDGNGFMKGVMGPGGAIYNVNPDGKNWELFAVGFRNQFDAGYNRAGDLFSYDADMEWDMNTPWYRPTRVCFVPSGAEFGWRNGAGKYPAYYPDNLPGICDIGPGSPTGTCFGYGAKFPAKYQDAYFICDWSYGKMYAVHLSEKGAGYTGVAEEFVTGSPLPLTDVIVNPNDGALYFAIGGRRTQSGLYRVTYTGDESTALVVVPKPRDADFSPRTFRKALENEIPKRTLDAADLGKVMEGLVSDESVDRPFRFAVRTVLERTDPKLWTDNAFAQTDATAAIHAMLALVRVSATDPFHRKPTDPPADPALRGKILAKLNAIDFAPLTVEQRLDLIRVYHILFNRFGQPTAEERKAWLAKFDPVLPTKNRYVDGELLQIFVYLNAPTAAAKGMALLAAAPTQEEQMEYARALRVLKSGWTPPQRTQYAEWLVAANNFRGGNSMKGFLTLIRDDFAGTLTAAEKTVLDPLLKKAAAGPTTAVVAAKPFVKKWAMDELAGKLEPGLAGRNFDRGRKLFSEAKCFNCHRYDNDGSSFGPDLSGVAGRFSPKDLLESLIDPNKEVSDQYAAVEIETLSGKKVIGRIVNLNGDNLSVNTDMLNPNGNTNVSRNDIESIKPSKQSMMPAGLLDVLKEDEVLDLMAYLLSRGDRGHKMFAK